MRLRGSAVFTGLYILPVGKRSAASKPLLALLYLLPIAYIFSNL